MREFNNLKNNSNNNKLESKKINKKSQNSEKISIANTISIRLSTKKTS